MKLSTTISAIVLATTTSLSLQALATTAPICDTKHGVALGGILTSSQWEDPLNYGDYAFLGAHRAGSSFFEELTFSLATPADVSIDLIDLKMPVTGTSNAFAAQYPNLFGNKYLTFSLFDNTGLLLGSAAAGSTLMALNLSTNNDYVLTVSGKTSGILGGVYAGNLSITAVTEVPIGATAPLLGSALLLLMGRVRKLRKVSNN